MGLLTRLLCLVLSFLMICSFTTSLLGTEQPTLKKTLEIISRVEIDVEGLFSEFQYELKVPDFEVPEDAGEFKKWLYELVEDILTVFLEVVAVVYLIIGVCKLLYAVADSFLYIASAVIYLMFGIDLIPSKAVQTT